MVAARWRTRRMWTIETGLLNAEILTQLTKTDATDPNIHLTMAFRSLTDDSRSLVLANRYEARLQRLYDRAYKTLRELQQTRKSEPTPPRTVHIRWVDPNEEPDQPTDQPMSSGQHPTSDTQPQSYNPSVSEGSEAERKAELRNEPTASTNKEVMDDPSKENSDEFCNPRGETHNPIGNTPHEAQSGKLSKEFE